MDNKSLYNKILSLEHIKDEDLLRINLFGYFSKIVLSKEIFKNNKELVEFIKSLGLEFRDYVYASRTVVVSRLIRHLEKRDINQLKEILNKMIEFLSIQLEIVKVSDDNTSNQKKHSESNYVKSIVEKYRRGN